MPYGGPLWPLLKWPDAKRWQKSACPAVIGTLAIGLIASLGGIAQYDSEALSLDTLGVLAMLFVIPAFGEELLFRWLLFPRAGLRLRSILMTGSVGLFVLWHPLQAWTGLGPTWSGLFLNPAFLACVAVFGVTLALLRGASGSLWPPVLFHWIVVAAWKLVFGGPF